MGIFFDVETNAERVAREEQQRKQQAAQALLGTPITRQESFVGGDVNLPADQPTPTGAVPGLTQPGLLDPNNFDNLETTQTPSGLLGSDLSPRAQTAFKTGLIGAGISGGDATSALAPIVAEQDRQAATATAAATAAEKANLRVGEFKDRKEQLDANRSFASDFKKDVAPFRAKQQFYSDTLGFGNIQDWSGTDDFIAIRNLIKQSLPNESVMGDDIANMKFSQGVPESIRTWIASLTGEGGLSVPGRKQLLDTMFVNATEGKKFSDELRANFQGQADQVNGLNTDFLLKPIPLPAPTTVFGSSAPKPVAPGGVGGLSDAEIAKQIAEQTPKRATPKRIRQNVNPRGI